MLFFFPHLSRLYNIIIFLKYDKARTIFLLPLDILAEIISQMVLFEYRVQFGSSTLVK